MVKTLVICQKKEMVCLYEMFSLILKRDEIECCDIPLNQVWNAYVLFLCLENNAGPLVLLNVFGKESRGISDTFQQFPCSGEVH